MEAIVIQLLELGIALSAFYVLAFATGIAKTHPLALLGKVIGPVLKAVLRLPVVFIRGLFGGLGEKHSTRLR